MYEISYNHKGDIALTSLALPDGKETENWYQNCSTRKKSS